jgi:hypothetical protein
VSEVQRTASCSCGGLTATVTGEPIRVSICHCLACQQRTGSAFGFQARFPAQDVELSGEATEYVRYADEDGEERRMYFCPSCGTTVYYRNASQPGVIAIAVGAFADPGFPPPSFSVWEERRHSWVSVPDGAERIH